MRKLLYTVMFASGEDPAWVHWWVEAHWPEPDPDSGGDVEHEQVWRSDTIIVKAAPTTIDNAATDLYLNGRRQMMSAIRIHARRNQPGFTELIWRQPGREHFAQYGVGLRWLVIPS